MIKKAKRDLAREREPERERDMKRERGKAQTLTAAQTEPAFRDIRANGSTSAAKQIRLQPRYQTASAISSSSHKQTLSQPATGPKPTTAKQPWATSGGGDGWRNCPNRSEESNLTPVDLAMLPHRKKP